MRGATRLDDPLETAVVETRESREEENSKKKKKKKKKKKGATRKSERSRSGTVRTAVVIRYHRRCGAPELASGHRWEMKANLLHHWAHGYLNFMLLAKPTAAKGHYLALAMV